MILWATVACGHGWISYPGGESDIETAIWIKGTIDGTDTVVMILSNSRLSCDLGATDEDDPAAVELALIEAAAALYREDARNLVLWLKRDAGDVLGSYDVSTDGSAKRWSEALYMGVNEAELGYDGGLVRYYEPTDYDVREAGAGTVELDRLDADTARGSFDFTDIEVAGRFTAEHCEDSVELFEQLGLLDLSPTDLFGAYDDAAPEDSDDIILD